MALGCFLIVRPDVELYSGLDSVFKLLIDISGQFNAFLLMISLSQTDIFDAFLRFNPTSMDFYYELFEKLLREKSKETYNIFREGMIHPSLYFMKWVLTLFSFVSEKTLVRMVNNPEL